jgi:regulator of sigma E protease
MTSMEIAQSLFVSVLAFVAVLSVVIFVHELGHYQVARFFKVKVDSFSLGMGKEVLGWTSKKTGVRWKLSMLPIGGYVMFTGDADESSRPDPNRVKGDPSTGLLHDQSVGVRAAVAAAGPAYNFVFAIAVFAVFLFSFGESYFKPVVGTVMQGSPAEQAGLEVGDEFVRFDGVHILSEQDVRRLVMTSANLTVPVEVRRDGQLLELTPTPGYVQRETEFGDKEWQGQLGFTFNGEIGRIEHNPLSAIGRGAERTWQIIDMQVRFIGALVRGAMSPGHLSGPVGIGQISGKVAENGAASAGDNANLAQRAWGVMLALVELTAVLSIAIGFMNLLPLPVLDGGRLVFCGLEAIMRRPVPDVIQAWAMRGSIVLLLGLFAFVTLQDIDRTGLFRMLSGGG